MLFLAGGVVSFSLCLAIFFITALFRKYRQTTQRVILYLTLAVCFLSFANILHGSRAGSLANNHTYCITIGFIDQVTNWMVLLAVCCLTFDLFVKVVFLKFDTSRYEAAYCVIIFVVPFLFNWIPFVGQAYGLEVEQCWIKLTNEDCSMNSYYISLRFILYWIPFLLIMSAVFLAYLIISIKARRQLNGYVGNYDPAENARRQLLYQEVRIYRVYPILWLIGYIAAVTSRIVEVADTERLFFGLKIIHVLAISFQGVAVAIVFALDYDTRKQLTQFNLVKVACYDFFCCCKQHKVTEYETEPVLTDSLRSEDASYYYYGSDKII